MPRCVVHNAADIEALQDQIGKAAKKARENLSRLVEEPMEALYKLKLRRSGYKLLEKEPDDSDNLIEQLNQTFTMMATLAAARRLLECFPETKYKGLQLNLGRAHGPDIKSIGWNLVEAEVFVAVTPRNNRKLKEDVYRVGESNATYRYVFFHCPDERSGRRIKLEDNYKQYLGKQPGIKVVIWSLEKSEILWKDHR
ncbi:MAG: hypothetical protein F4X65_02370 [Chloroflexi bacterium]|nr:hypothetical protein [Chloroflexota bacterium]